MAGSPTWGKISTGMRLSARPAQRAIARRATTTVMGRERAASTSFIRTRLSFGGLGDKRLEVARGGCDAEKATPDGEACEGVVDLGLREEALGFGYVVNDA